MKPERHHPVAIGASSIFTVGTAMIFHELAHAAAGWMAGGSPTLVTATEVRGDFASLSPAGFAALGVSGSLVNVLFCVVAGWVLARRSISADLRLGAWFVFAFNGMLVATKMMAEPLAGFGDWMTVLRRMPMATFGRGLVTAAGTAAVVFMVRRSGKALAQLVPDAAPARRRAEALRIVLAGAAAAAMLLLGSAVAVPGEKSRGILLALGVLGPFIPMLFTARIVPRHPASDASAPARTRWPWVVAAGITAALLWFVFGPGLALSSVPS